MHVLRNRSIAPAVCAIALSMVGPDVEAADLTASTTLTSLDQRRVIVDGVDVTEFAELRDGVLEIAATSDIARRPVVTIVDAGDSSVVEILTRVRQKAATFSGSGISDFNRNANPDHSIRLSPGFQVGSNGWTIAGRSNLTGIDRKASSRFNIQETNLSVTRVYGEDLSLAMQVGEVSHELGNEIAAPSLTGRGLLLSFQQKGLTIGAIFVGANSPVNYIDESNRFGSNAYRYGLSAGYAHEGDALSWSLGLQHLWWSNEDETSGDKGQSWGLTAQAYHGASDTSLQLAWARSETPDDGKANALLVNASRSFEVFSLPVSVSATYGRADPGVNQPETFWNADLENVDLTGEIDLSWGAVALGYAHARDNIRNVSDRLVNRTRTARLGLSIWQMPEALGFLEAVTIETERQSTDVGNATAYLAATGDSAEYLPRAVYSSVSLSFDLAVDNGGANLTLTDGYYDERMIAVRLADTRERSVSLSRSWEAGDWNFDTSVRYNLTSETDPDAPSRSTSWDYAFGIGWSPQSLPQISARYGLFRSRFEFPAWDERSKERVETISLTADLTPWLHRIGLHENVSSAFSWTTTRTSAGGSSERQHDAGFQLAMSF